VVDGDWQHQHFRPGTAKAAAGRTSGRLIAIGAALSVLLGITGLALSEWLGYTNLGLHAWITGLFPAAETQPAATPNEEPAAPAGPTSIPADSGPRVRQLAALIAQQERGIDLMQRELTDATHGETVARQEADAAAARVASADSYIASTRLTARQLADARNVLAAASADLNNARRRAKELGEKRQSLTTRIAKAGAIRDDARRESERLTTPMPVAAPP
jgi:hypothetical protein